MGADVDEDAVALVAEEVSNNPFLRVLGVSRRAELLLEDAELRVVFIDIRGQARGRLSHTKCVRKDQS